MRLKSFFSSAGYLRLAFLFLLVALFLFSLFANISHPLLWNDEGTTAVAGERVLQYGYPKVHDGKNVLYDLNHPDYSIGIDEKTDAFIADANWAMYYVAAAGVWAASMTDDLYLKTAFIRFPFALAGFAGLVLLAWNACLFFRERKSRLNFLVAFSVLSLLSVPLVLHLREVRYYSLLLFFLSLVIYIFSAHHIRRSITYLKYCLLLVPALAALFLSFPPVFFMFCVDGALFLFLLYLLQFYRNQKNGITVSTNTRLILIAALKAALPFTAAFILLLPALRYFKLFEMADTLSMYYGFNFERYKENLVTVWDYLSVYDFLLAAIVLKATSLLPGRKAAGNPVSASLIKFSSFLSIVFIVHFFLIARIPTYIFIRYFIVLTPILACIVLMDAAVIFSAIQKSSFRGKNIVKSVGIVVFLILLSGPVAVNSRNIREHWYESTHENNGCLDFAVDFIKSKYKHTDSLVISTNYEEPVLMYYLHSKVIIGYIKNNLAEDTLLQPDIIIYRRGWAWRDDEKIFRDQLAKASYDSVFFPVADYPVNTIAEIVTPSQGLGHLFRTQLTENPAEQLKIYCRKNDFH